MTTKRAVVLPFVIYSLFNFTSMLLEVPTVRLFEHATCVRHFQREVEEAECKTPGIQNTLSQVVGWKLTLDACAGLATAMFYGSIAERWGEGIVLFISTIGYLGMQLLDMFICAFPYAFPIRMVWFSSMMLLLGGGQRVFNSMVYTLIANALEEDRRTTFFYWLAFGPHCMRFIAPGVASGLMRIGLFAPFWMGVPTLVFQASLIFLSIDSKSMKLMTKGYSSVAVSEDITADDAEPPQSTTELQTTPRQSHESQHSTSEAGDGPTMDTTARKRLLTFLRKKSRDFVVLLAVPNALFSLSSVFLKKIGFSSGNFASQYVSETFKWQLRDTTWIRAASGAGAISIGIIAPVVTAQLLKRGFNPPSVDLGSIRAALTILSVSFLATWLASSGSFILIAMFGVGFGEGLEPALQGFLSFCVGSMSKAKVFTVYAFVDAAAELMAGPLMARLLAIGRTDTHPSDGICFLVSSGIFFFLLIWAVFVRVRQISK